MRVSWVLTVLSICLSALATAAGAEGKRKLQIGVKKRVDHCPIKSRKGDVLHMHYTGKLEDGTEFDSSLPQNQPFVFSLGTGQVIKGWDQGLLGMCEGEKRKLVIPSELGLAVSSSEDRARPLGCWAPMSTLCPVPGLSQHSQPGHLGVWLRYCGGQRPGSSPDVCRPTLPGRSSLCFSCASLTGYGERGAPPKIPGGATLVFEVELLKIERRSEL
ncbi:FKBP prolyl isomerase 2 [Phyllostomus discolor]|uniref:peptidylprolyl isomerase n=1 Tax=Phyllostomus discolor TaxID=89673 RepID=A0A833ZVT7_9CHIR|nr:FKBP prolyl isomerase 2 [Phyllostomus discolor]